VEFILAHDIGYVYILSELTPIINTQIETDENENGCRLYLFLCLSLRTNLVTMDIVADHLF
jgi:hypothetical protein